MKIEGEDFEAPEPPISRFFSSFQTQVPVLKREELRPLNPKLVGLVPEADVAVLDFHAGLAQADQFQQRQEPPDDL